MSHEIRVSTPTQELSAFLQDGFYSFDARGYVATNMHMHNYAEVHLLLGGDAAISAGGEKYLVHSGEMLIIPRGILHTTVSQDGAALHTAFQISLEPEGTLRREVDVRLLSAFFDEIRGVQACGDCGRLSAFIALLCFDFCKNATRVGQSVTDNGFLIQEFFSMRYAEELKVSDLSSILHLSDRQTERVVRQYTGMTFGEKLADTRLTVAEHLMRAGDMSLAQIAEYVGYRSYAGFWKAMKKRTEA